MFKNTKKIDQLESEISDLKEKYYTLKGRHIDLQTKFNDLSFVIQNPSQYEIGQKTPKGIILEKRVVSLAKIIFSKEYLAPLVNYVIGNKPIPEFMKPKLYWEYRIFNRNQKTEKWYKESEIFNITKTK